jgi:DNA-binding NarL/FixJ family response regulator
VPERPIRLLLAEDHALVREGLGALLGLEPRLSVVGTVERGDQVVTAALETDPDVILMDIQMPGLDGIAATAQICAQRPEANVLILSNYGDDAYVLDALTAGARGYLMKDASSEELINAILAAASGQSYLPSSISARVLRGLAPRRLTKEVEAINLLTRRELEVLLLVAQGSSNREIALGLGIRYSTVKTHVSNILSKLNVADRAKAMVYALENGLATPRPGH